MFSSPSSWGLGGGFEQNPIFERILFYCNILQKSFQKTTTDSIRSSHSFQDQEDGPGFDSSKAKRCILADSGLLLFKVQTLTSTVIKYGKKICYSFCRSAQDRRNIDRRDDVSQSRL